MKIIQQILLLLSLFALTSCNLAGKVVKVSDGDTLTILDNKNEQHKIRLAQIDAPELGQPWGNRSKQALNELVMHKVVEIEIIDTDDYGRKVGIIFVDGKDICKEQLASGNAWVYRYHLRDPSLLKIEEDAKTKKRGLWSDPNPTPPWQWRKEKRNKN